jgi:hypothetical protein
MLGSSRVAAQLAAFREGLGSMSEVRFIITLIRQLLLKWMTLCVSLISEEMIINSEVLT